MEDSGSKFPTPKWAEGQTRREELVGASETSERLTTVYEREGGRHAGFVTPDTARPEELNLSPEDQRKLLAMKPETWPRARWFMMAVIMAATLGIGAFLIHEAAEHRDFGQIDFLRGVITVVFTAAVSLIAFNLVLMVLMGGTNAYAARMRFREGKEVLILLIGILGTVLGFYFGNTGTTPADAGGFMIDRIAISDAIAGGEVLIVVETSGGEGPFSYEMTFDPPDVPPIANSSNDPAFQEKASLSNVSVAGQVSVTIKVTDANDDKAEVTQHITVEPPRKVAEPARGTPQMVH